MLFADTTPVRRFYCSNSFFYVFFFTANSMFRTECLHAQRPTEPPTFSRGWIEGNAGPGAVAKILQTFHAWRVLPLPPPFSLLLFYFHLANKICSVLFLKPTKFVDIHSLIHELSWTFVWLRGTVVERRSLTGELSLSCASPAVDGWPLMWVNRPL